MLIRNLLHGSQNYISKQEKSIRTQQYHHEKQLHLSKLGTVWL